MLCYSNLAWQRTTKGECFRLVNNQIDPPIQRVLRRTGIGNRVHRLSRKTDIVNDSNSCLWAGPQRVGAGDSTGLGGVVLWVAVGLQSCGFTPFFWGGYSQSRQRARTGTFSLYRFQEYGQTKSVFLFLETELLNMLSFGIGMSLSCYSACLACMNPWVWPSAVPKTCGGGTYLWSQHS